MVSRVEDLRALTSLRFFAAMMIVLLHAKLYFPWAWLPFVPSTFIQGVSFFFVLSGFILTHVYTSKPIPSYFRFVMLRAGRLWPVHAFAVLPLVISALTPLVIVQTGSITFDGDGIFNRWYVLVMNLALVQSLSPYIVHVFSWNGVSWSISTEFCFYLAFPFLIVGIEKTWGRKLAVAAGLVATMLIANHLLNLTRGAGLDELRPTYANPLFRGFEFCLGMAAYIIWNRQIRNADLSPWIWTVVEVAMVVIVIAWLLVAWLYSDLFNRGYAIGFTQFWVQVAGSCWAFAALIVTFASGKGIVGRFLGLWPCVFLGEISYSIYMLHYILMKVFSAHELLNAGEIVFFGALIIVSALSYMLVERPARNAVRATMRIAKSHHVPPSIRQTVV
jgi:peptidoglycan/LPS O-acetylase OafA/YrhL